MLDVNSWQSIFEQSGTIEFQFVLRFRLICTESNRGCIQLFLSNKKPEMYTRRTMISLHQCMYCDCNENKVYTFSYLRDSFPRRQLICCREWNCWSNAFCKFIIDARDENVYPFLKWNCMQVIDVPRTSGDFSNGVIDQYSPVYKDGRVCVRFEDIHKQQQNVCVKSLNLSMTKLVLFPGTLLKQYLTTTAILFSNLFQDYAIFQDLGFASRAPCSV